jgi:hypothetical protein
MLAAFTDCPNVARFANPMVEIASKAPAVGVNQIAMPVD